MWAGLGLKMALSAGLVVAASLLVERSGPLLGAMIATLPVSAGPAYVFLALEHGPDFIARSALASLAAIAATMLYVTVYARLARRLRLPWALAAGLAVWLGAVTLITRRAWTLPGALALVGCVFVAGLALTWRCRGVRATAGVRRGRWDIPARALAVMAVVGLAVLAGRVLGPRAAGVIALAPVVFTSLVCILHPRIGGPATGAVLANALPGVLGNAVSLTLVHLAAPRIGSAAALLGALGLSFAWNGSLLWLGRPRRDRAPAHGVDPAA